MYHKSLLFLQSDRRMIKRIFIVCILALHRYTYTPPPPPHPFTVLHIPTHSLPLLSCIYKGMNIMNESKLINLYLVGEERVGHNKPIFSRRRAGWS